MRRKISLKDIEPSECKCSTCKSMCTRPCWPSPEEANKMLDAGLTKSMWLDWWESSKELDYTEIVGPANNMRGGLRADVYPSGHNCIFFVEGLCKLHTSGYKPIEGRLANCKEKSETQGNLHLEVAKLWNSPLGRSTIVRWKKEVDRAD